MKAFRNVLCKKFFGEKRWYILQKVQENVEDCTKGRGKVDVSFEVESSFSFGLSSFPEIVW